MALQGHLGNRIHYGPCSQVDTKMMPKDSYYEGQGYVSEELICLLIHEERKLGTVHL